MRASVPLGDDLADCLRLEIACRPTLAHPSSPFSRDVDRGGYSREHSEESVAEALGHPTGRLRGPGRAIPPHRGHSERYEFTHANGPTRTATVADSGRAAAGVWSIYFNTVLLATLNERDFVIRG